MTRLFDLDFQLVHDAVLMIIAIFALFLFMSRFLFDPARKFLTGRTERIKNDIVVARGFGDLSENAEYDAAKDEQGKLYARIAEIEAILSTNPDGVVIIDEAYAVTAAHPTGWTAPRLLAMQISMHVYWVGGGLLGVAVAWAIPGTIAGLDFALLALFITLTLDAVRSREQLPSLLIATVAFFAALLIIPDQIVFAGMILFMVLLTIRYFTAQRKGGLYDAAGD